MPSQYRPLTSSLRTKLLIITVVFVMIVEAFVYLPSIATFRETYLSQSMKAAQLAALSLEANPANRISPELEKSLLASAGVVSVVMMRNNQSRMLGFEQMPSDVAASYDLRGASLGELISGAFDTLEAKGERYITIIGTPTLADTRWVEVTLYEKELYKAMSAHSNNLFFLSAFISLSTGLLVYLTLHWAVVRPMRRLKREIADYRANPEDPARLVSPSKRRDEIGIIARELRSTQMEVQKSFQQKKHLADLGEAISKINHDLRGMLTTASLASETLSHFKDPVVMRITARLERALTRAIDLCTRTLTQGTAKEPAPVIRPLKLIDLIEETAESLMIAQLPCKLVMTDIGAEQIVYGDKDQLFRVLHNLMKNALQAMEGQKDAVITLAAFESDQMTVIEISDTGPGFSEAAKDALFQPFKSAEGQNKGGTGLGLVIAKEIIEAHHGTLDLAQTSDKGSHFVLTLPIQAEWDAALGGQ